MNINKVAAYWNKRGKTYSRSWESLAKKKLSRMELEYFRKALNVLRKNSPKKKYKVLDVGVAIGRICDEIVKHEVELYGTDISQEMIDYCKKKYAKNKKVKELQIHDIHKPLPKKWGTFDIVTAYRVLAYTHGMQTELKNIHASLNKGGALIFTCPNKYSSILLPRLFHKNRLGYEVSYSELKEIVKKAGFSQFRIEGFSRLLDTFYDKADSQQKVRFLFNIEKILGFIFGPRLFVRLFYVTCIK